MKQALIGRARSTEELHSELLPKWTALPVFASDPLSSTAYATQEMMLVLVLAGAGAFTRVLPLAVAVALLLAVVVASYRQTVHAYPHGGGAYIVAKENLGQRAGLVAGAALLIDYTLTVAVSIAAGVGAVIAAAPGLIELRVPIALALVALVALANLRGVREAGLFFAIPTYGFVAVMLTLIVVGAARCLGGCPPAPSAGRTVEAAEGLTLFLILRAFSSGATALTGVEAISNGVPAFRRPQSRNAATTLAVMGVLAVTMFLGVSALAVGTGVVPTEESVRDLTVNAEIARAVFGSGPGFYLVQIVTAAILILAANTSYADFPRLASVLAGDRYLPRQFVTRGDRLVFSNGVLVLAGSAMLLLVVFSADVTRLVQLYVVGVFTSFTLSQAGMVRHHLRVKESHWRRAAVINAVGAATTGIVLLIVAVTKFTGGAWLVLVGVPLLVLAMQRISDHYNWVEGALTSEIEPEPVRSGHVRILLDRVDESVARAISYALAIQPSSIVGLAVPGEPDLIERWNELAGDLPLEFVSASTGSKAVGAFAERLRQDVESHPDGVVTALIAETLSVNWVEQLREHRLALNLKRALVDIEGLVVADLTSPQAGPGPYTLEEPHTHHVIVLVSRVNQATMRALSYAKGLSASTVTALSIALENDRAQALLDAWGRHGIDVPLEIVESPFRSLVDVLTDEVAALGPDGRRVVVTCVLPQFVLPHWYQRPLHNQTALLVKGALLFERGAVATSVPLHVSRERTALAPTPTA